MLCCVVLVDEPVAVGEINFHPFVPKCTTPTVIGLALARFCGQRAVRQVRPQECCVAYSSRRPITPPRNFGNDYIAETPILIETDSGEKGEARGAFD